VGWYFDPNGIHGFSDINGVYSSFDAPGATQTYAYGVNNSGQIVGYYVDANGVNHGFLDTPVPSHRRSSCWPRPPECSLSHAYAESVAPHSVTTRLPRRVAANVEL